MKKFFIFLAIFSIFNLSADNLDAKKAESKDNKIQSIEEAKLDKINEKIQKNDSIWLKRYLNHNEYLSISNEIKRLEKEINRLSINHNENLELIDSNKRKIEILERQLELLKDYKEDPFKDLTQAPEIPEIPEITNPFSIFSGFSLLKTLQNQQDQLNFYKNSLSDLIALIEEKYNTLILIGRNDKRVEIAEQIVQTQFALLEFQAVQNILNTTIEVYKKRYDEAHVIISAEIKEQVTKLIYIGIAILLSVGIAFLLKIVVRRYINNNERAYTFSKVINFFNLTIIILILLFSYMENATYVVAVLGFASAGLAIAMKDLFMSLLGWIVIIIGGSVHVGDRIRVEKDGSTYIGDVLDISMLRITIYEDITLTSYKENRRAGRIIFIPNNYIFTMMIANYTHSGMRTVWDGIDIKLTFDSNIQKAAKIATQIAIKYAKGYTQVTNKQLRKMRDQYSLRPINTEPRIYTFIENNGIALSVWYQTNAYATLGLRSTISFEIIQAFLKEKDIFVAYETTKFVQNNHDGFNNKPFIEPKVKDE